MQTDKRYTLVLRRILKKCEQYPEIFQEGSAPINLFHATPFPDERAYVNISRREGKIVYTLDGNYFNSSETKSPPSIKVVAKELQDLNMTPERLASFFKEAIIRHLGEPLARKELEGLEEKILR